MPGWFFVERGQAVGPVSFEVLGQRVRAGVLGANDLVCAEGAASWQVAYSVPGLFDAPTGTGPAAPPVPPPATPGAGYGQYAPPPPQQGTLPYGGYAPANQYSGHPVGASQQGMAIAGFVLAFILSPLGLIFSAVALSGMKRERNEEGKGLAIAGLVISIISLLLGCFWFGLVATVFRASRW